MKIKIFFLASECEVMSATGSVAQVSTWAGWAVGAVTSKFYKSPVGEPPQKRSSEERHASTSSEISEATTKSSSLDLNSGAPSRTSTRAEDETTDYDEWEGDQWEDEVSVTLKNTFAWAES